MGDCWTEPWRDAGNHREDQVVEKVANLYFCVRPQCWQELEYVASGEYLPCRNLQYCVVGEGASGRVGSGQL